MDYDRELELMKLCVHSHVIRLMDFFETKLYKYMVLEFEAGDSLKNYLYERNNLIKEERAKDIAQKIA